jgi:hypothetical protein
MSLHWFNLVWDKTPIFDGQNRKAVFLAGHMTITRSVLRLNPVQIKSDGPGDALAPTWDWEKGWLIFN